MSTGPEAAPVRYYVMGHIKESIELQILNLIFLKKILFFKSFPPIVKTRKVTRIIKQ